MAAKVGHTGAGGLIPVSGIVLAGGVSSRMASPKALLTVGGRRIIDREIDALSGVLDEVVVVTRSPEAFSGVSARVVTDTSRFPGMAGPLVGLYTGLSEASNPYGFVVGCDMPFIEARLVVRMAVLRAGRDLVLPMLRGYPEPLFGVYSKAALPVIEAALAEGDAGLQAVIGRLDALFVREEELRRFDPELRSLMNVNTPEELELARGLAGDMV